MNDGAKWLRAVYFWYVICLAAKKILLSCVFYEAFYFVFLLGFLFVCLFLDIFVVFILWLFLDLTPGTNVVLRNKYGVRVHAKTGSCCLRICQQALRTSNSAVFERTLWVGNLNIRRWRKTKTKLFWQSNCYKKLCLYLLMTVPRFLKDGIQDSNLKATLPAYTWFGALL